MRRMGNWSLQINKKCVVSLYTVRAQVTAKLKQLTDLFEAGKLMLAEDFLIDVHTGTWFANIAMSGIVGILIAGPIGFAVVLEPQQLSPCTMKEKSGKH